MKTLAEIIESEKNNRIESGDFGITACKKSIKFAEEYFHESLYQQLEQFAIRANEDVFFNKAMILACWELTNERKDN